MQPCAASAAKNENRLSQNGTIIQHISHLLYNTEDSICQAQFTSLYLHQVFQSRIPTDPLTCPDTMSDSSRNFVLSACKYLIPELDTFLSQQRRIPGYMLPQGFNPAPNLFSSFFFVFSARSRWVKLPSIIL